MAKILYRTRDFDWIPLKYEYFVAPPDNEDPILWLKSRYPEYEFRLDKE